MTSTETKRHHEQLNLGYTERLASLIGGGALMAVGLKQRSLSGLLAAAAGGALAYRGATGHCHVYEALGVRSRPSTGRNVSVPYELGVRVDCVVTVEKPAAELYAFWRNLENLPRFMKHLDSVTEIDNKHSHWVARGPASTSVQWRAEIINEVENQLIGWRSLPGADVPNAGSVQFKPAREGEATEVKVELQYNPPAGHVGAWVAKMLGQDPQRQIDEDLRRFKQLMETGEIVTTKGQPVGPQQLAREAVEKPASRKGWNRDVVSDASEESFPASDPPSWTPTGGSVSNV